MYHSNKSRCALLPGSSQPSNHGPSPDSKDLEPRAGLQILPSQPRLSRYLAQTGTGIDPSFCAFP